MEEDSINNPEFIEDQPNNTDSKTDEVISGIKRYQKDRLERMFPYLSEDEVKVLVGKSKMYVSKIFRANPPGYFCD